MKFNPEDGLDTGPRCRNCHKGSSGCGACHNTDPLHPVNGINTTTVTKDALAADNSRAGITFLFAAMFDMAHAYDAGVPAMGAESYAPITRYETTHTATGLANGVAQLASVMTVTANGVAMSGQVKKSRTVSWSSGWRTNPGILASTCNDDGLSFPHRTLGWKMLKDDLFGIDPGKAGTLVGEVAVVTAGTQRTGTYGTGSAVHDLDSVCLDCHNPTVWNATSARNYTDGSLPGDDYNDDLLLRGLP
ncbi:MAG TPA: hypothetical protein VGK02_09465 [Candidatus Aquicultor sp.]|jgi:hypothetical protein